MLLSQCQITIHNCPNQCNNFSGVTLTLDPVRLGSPEGQEA